MSSRDQNMHSKNEIKKLVAQAKANYSRGDAESIKRCCQTFIDLRKDFENFRQARLQKVPDVNIYHFVQFLAMQGMAKKLPREADRFKLILNLSIQQQWTEALKNIFTHTAFISLKGIPQQAKSHKFDISEIFKSIISLVLYRHRNKDLIRKLSLLDNCIKSYVTYYHYGNVIILITYEKWIAKKNQILSYYLYMNNQIKIYNSEKKIIFDEVYYPADRSTTSSHEQCDSTNTLISENSNEDFDRTLFPEFAANVSEEDLHDYILSIFT